MFELKFSSIEPSALSLIKFETGRPLYVEKLPPIIILPVGKA